MLHKKVVKTISKNSLTRYLIVGGTAFLLDYLSFYFLFKSMSNLVMSTTVSFLIGLLVSFFLNRNWTFQGGSYHKKTSHQMVLYISLAVANLLLSNILIQLLNKIGIIPMLGKLVVMVSIAGWNFVIFKLHIFKIQPEDIVS